MGEIAAAMELRSLHYFVRIAELGSITRASAHLQIAQPALTRHVQRLEDELDAALFTRANRGVRLTEAGQKLLDNAERILRDVERVGDEIRAHKAHPSGKIILGVTPTLCPVVVPELFARMRDHYPLIELKVVHAGTVRLEEFIVAGLVDVALMAEISKSRLIASTRLAEEEMVLVTRPGARPSGAVSAEELNRTPLILGDGLRAALDVLLAGRGIALQVDTELNDHETIRLMVQQGVGASILPLFLGLSRMRARAGASAPAHRVGDLPHPGVRCGGESRPVRRTAGGCRGRHRSARRYRKRRQAAPTCRRTVDRDPRRYTLAPAGQDRSLKLTGGTLCRSSIRRSIFGKTRGCRRITARSRPIMSTTR